MALETGYVLNKSRCSRTLTVAENIASSLKWKVVEEASKSLQNKGTTDKVGLPADDYANAFQANSGGTING